MFLAAAIELVPLRGAGDLRFGMTYDDVVRVLGEPEQPLVGLWRSEARRAGWRGGGLAVHFNPAVACIEVCRGAGWTVTLAGVDVDLLQTPADQVLDILEKHGYRARSEGPKPGYTFLLREIGCALWRQFVPESAGDPEGRYFDTVSLGVNGYFG